MRSIQVSQEIADYVDEQVRKGEAESANEVIRAAFELKIRIDLEYASRLRTLRDDLALGRDSVHRGEAVSMSTEELLNFIKQP